MSQTSNLRFLILITMQNVVTPGMSVASLLFLIRRSALEYFSGSFVSPRRLRIAGNLAATSSGLYDERHYKVPKQPNTAEHFRSEVSVMRLSEFILENVEPILLDSEAFDRSLSPSVLINPNADKRKFRDHAADTLSAIAHDMVSDKLGAQQSDNSEGIECQNENSLNLIQRSNQHDADRYDSQFDVSCVIAEYRALRRSVIRLWQLTIPIQIRVIFKTLYGSTHPSTNRLQRQFSVIPSMSNKTVMLYW